ncbi:MAG: SDR family oxidoreductase, partial [Treponema sp.]|nr:SDR family oxidoreductase [Treponema sp.]
MNINAEKVSLPPWLKKFSLEGKTAVITGAASGLGKAVASGMAASGAAVVIADIDKQGAEQFSAELAAAGFRAAAKAADITKTADVRELVSRTVETFGGIDILVNAAGTTFRQATEDFDEQAFDKIISLNLKGTFLCLKYAGQEMLKRGKGSIINFGSIASVVANPHSAGYSCSKGGVALMTRTAGVEWASRGVRVNAVVPGTFYTPLLQKCIDEQPDYEETFLKRYPIGRFGDPEEIIGVCVYLASDAASYVTGALYAV